MNADFIFCMVFAFLAGLILGLRVQQRRYRKALSALVDKLQRKWTDTMPAKEERGKHPFLEGVHFGIGECLVLAADTEVSEK